MPSSVIRKFDYDPAEQQLAVTFVSGRRYAYHDVPEEIAAGLRGAFSKGVYFNAVIRDQYPCGTATLAVGIRRFEPVIASLCGSGTTERNFFEQWSILVAMMQEKV